MKFVLALTLPLTLLVGVAVYDMGEAARAKTKPPFGCRAPSTEGDLAIITITVRSGELVAECQHATTRPSKLRKGG